MWFWLNVIPQEIVVNSWMFRCVVSKLDSCWWQGRLRWTVFASVRHHCSYHCHGLCHEMRGAGCRSRSHEPPWFLLLLRHFSTKFGTFGPTSDLNTRWRFHAVEPTSDYCIINESANILHQFSMEIVFMPKKHKSLQSVTRKSFTFRR